jgi:hypothetical protein
LIGREAERARLQAAASEAGDGRGSLLLLAGEAGIGKTVLARPGLLAADECAADPDTARARPGGAARCDCRGT